MNRPVLLTAAAAAAVLMFPGAPPAHAGGLGLVLPSDNRAIFSTDPSAFYMYTNRSFEGVDSRPWQGGTYGFVRNQKRTAAGLIYTRFHEGVDIRPARRSSDGKPLDLLLSSRFERWYDLTHDQRRDPNYHGIFSGLNLAGLDVAGFFLAHRKNPGLRLSEFISRMAIYCKVTVPNRGPLEIVQRYPWLLHSSTRNPPSWEISLSSSGIPLSVAPSSRSVSRPAVTWVKPSPTYHSYLTRGRLGGSGSKATLSSSGLGYIQLLTGQF